MFIIFVVCLLFPLFIYLITIPFHLSVYFFHGLWILISSCVNLFVIVFCRLFIYLLVLIFSIHYYLLSSIQFHPLSTGILYHHSLSFIIMFYPPTIHYLSTSINDVKAHTITHYWWHFVLPFFFSKTSLTFSLKKNDKHRPSIFPFFSKSLTISEKKKIHDTDLLTKNSGRHLSCIQEKTMVIISLNNARAFFWRAVLPSRRQSLEAGSQRGFI